MSAAVCEMSAVQTSTVHEEGTPKGQGVSFGDQLTSVHCWVIGRLSAEGKVSCVLFGQFSRVAAPPSDGWIYIGRNIVQDINSTDREEKQSQEAAPKSKIISSENDLYEPQMDGCRGDKVRVEVMKTQAVVATDEAARDAAAAAPILRVGGCALGSVNGRYIEGGHSNGCMRFRNVKGWVIFRQSLFEIPELGIYADSCYDAFKGPSIRDVLDRRAEFAATDLLKSEMQGGSKEGTAGFKRRFLEVSRAGSRMVSGDQQTALIRDEQLKASLRTQADIKMLQMISAIEAADDPTQHRGVRLKPLARTLSSLNAPGNIDDNIEFQLGKSRNIQNQTLTLSMLPKNSSEAKGKRKKQPKDHRINREAELSVHATKAIARRELELNRLSLEAADLNRTYLGMDEAADSDSARQLISLGLENFFSQMAAVRSATIEVAEALGAWSRFVMLQRKAHAEQVAAAASMGMSADPREGRAYCVAIAVKGAPLYPKSKPLVSSNNRACRGEEPEKLALDIKYVGIYERKADAIAAYRHACIEVPIENRVMPYVDAPPMYVGLRVCGRHYLVRSDFVPPKLPCEQCGAKTNAQPKLLVPSMASTLDVDAGVAGAGANDKGHNKITLPQFIWHGVNYIDKMWSDLDFIGSVDALRRYPCGIDPYMNPLLLPKDEVKDFYATLNRIHATSSKTGAGKGLQVLQRLKGRYEQLDDAKAASRWNQDHSTGFEYMGVAYRVSNAVPDLNKMQDYIPAPGQRLEHALAEGPRKSKRNPPLEGALDDIANLPGPMAPRAGSADTAADRQHPKEYNSTARTNIEESMNTINGSSQEADSASSTAQPSSRFGAGITLSASEQKRSVLAATAEAAALSMSLSQKFLSLDSNQPEFGSTALDFTGDELFSTDPAGNGIVVGPEKGSVMRALSILSQSEVADPFQFEEDVMTFISSAQKKALASSTRRNVFGSTSEKLYSKTAPARGLGVEGQHRREDDSPAVEKYKVKAAYDLHGARFETVQTRKAVANRTPSTWCRSDVGEWAGLSTKGPNMKAWEHRDRALTNARLAAEKRKEMQHMIRAAISFDFVSCDVPWITELISRAQGMKGSVLGLDILQAELFLKNRLKAIAACKKIQSWRRGVVSRRIVRALRAMIKRAQIHRFVTETESAKFANVYIPDMLQSVVRDLTKRHTASLVSFTINLRGVSVIANVHAMSRNAKKTRRLCYSCRLAPGAGTTKFAAGLHKKVLDRVPCTCRYITEPEKWLLKIYEPLSCYSFTRVFSIAEVRSLIRSTHAVDGISPKQHRARVIAPSGVSSLDDIRTQLELGPLYRLLLRPGGDASRGGQGSAQVDAAMAWLRAQKEGVAMALQMRGISDRLLREVCREEPVPNQADYFIKNNKYEIVLCTRKLGEDNDAARLSRSVNVHSKTVSVVGSLAHAKHFALSELLAEKYKFFNEFRIPLCNNSGKLPDQCDYDTRTIRDRKKNDDNCDGSTAASDLKLRAFSGLAGRVVTVSDTDSDLPPPFNQPTSTWEPLQDILSARYHMRRLRWSRPGLEQGVASATSQWEAARDAAHEHRFSTLERLHIESEDARSRVYMCDIQIRNAEDRVEAVMKFSKRKLSKFEAEQANTEEDWREAWEGVEDGTAWIGLNEARKKKRVLKKLLSEFEECVRVVDDALVEQARLYGVQRVTRQWMEFMLRCLASSVAEERDIKETSSVLEDLARETLTAVMSRLSMSRACGVPSTGYRISVPTLDLSYIRDPLLRNHRSMRSAWNLIRRQVRRLTGWDRSNEHFPNSNVEAFGPDLLSPCRKDPNFFGYARRFMQGTAVRFRAITVSKDPVTGCTIIDTGMEVKKRDDEAPEPELSVYVYPEENAYESDGYILEDKFRTQVESCFPSDIVLSEEEVKMLCRRYGRGTQTGSVDVVRAATESKYDFTKAAAAHRDRKMGVVVFPRRRHHLDALPLTYHARRQKLEKQEESDANRLLSMMRLNPHSGRICVGLLHLIRRGKSIEQALTNSLWYKDWLEGECASTWTNEQAHFLHMFSGRFCLVSVRDAFGSAEVRLSFYGMDPITVTITIPLEDIVLSMLEKPFLLATFVCDLIVNRYSADIVDHIVSCLDLEFPGECDRKMRRADLFGETPRLMFCANKFDRYRPVFRTHRLLCGAYFCVQVLVSAADDLMVVLRPPIDGQFWCHAYRGKDIPVEITLAEIRSIVLKHARPERNNDDFFDGVAILLRPDFYRNLSVLHPSEMNSLLDFLLSRLVVDKAVIAASIRQTGFSNTADDGGSEEAETAASSTCSEDTSDDSDDDDSENKSDFAGGSSVLSSHVPSGGAPDKSSYLTSLGSSILRYKDSVAEEGPELRRATSATKRSERFAERDGTGYISWASEEEDHDTDDESFFDHNFQRGKRVPMRVPGGRRITQKIIKNVIATAKLYNRWARKRRSALPELDLRSHVEVFRRFFAEYSVLNDTGSKDYLAQGRTPLAWKLIDMAAEDEDSVNNLDKSSTPGSIAEPDGDRIHVHEELWTTLDPLRFAPPMLPSGGDRDDAATLPSGPVADYIPTGVGTSTYWSLRVSTSGDKEMLHLLASPANLGAGRAQVAVAERESKQMQDEEKHRRQADVTVAALREEQSQAAVLFSVNKSIAPMAAKLSVQRDAAILQMKLLDGALRNVVPAVDAYFVKRGLSLYKLGRDRVVIDGDGTARVCYEMKRPPMSSARSLFCLSGARSLDDWHGSIHGLKRQYPVKVLRSLPPAVVETLDWMSDIMKTLESVSLNALLYGKRCSIPGQESTGIQILFQTKANKAQARPGVTQKRTDTVMLEATRERMRNAPFVRQPRGVTPPSGCCAAGHCPAHSCRSSPDPYHNPRTWQLTDKVKYDWEFGHIAHQDTDFLERALMGIKPKKIMNALRRVVYISEPSISLLGSCSFHMYEPDTMKSHVALMGAPLIFPLSVGPCTSETCDTTLTSYLVKETAQRIVWRSIVHGVAAAAVAHCCEQITGGIEAAELQLGSQYLEIKTAVQLDMIQKEQNRATSDKIKDQGAVTSVRKKYLQGEGGDHGSNRRLRATGVYMPFDEDIAPFPFDVDTEEWDSTVRRFLFPQLAEEDLAAARVDRATSLPAMVYFHSGFQGAVGASAAAAMNARFNMRLSRWLFESSMQVSRGAADGEINFTVPEIYGDAVVMLRRRPDEETISRLLLWSEKRLVDLNSLREKRQRTATNRMYKRFDNFLHFRDFVFYWAARFEPAFKQLFGVVGTLRNDNMSCAKNYPELDSELITIDYFRSLLSNVMSVARSADEKCAIGFSTLDQAFLVDTDIASGDRARGHSFGHVPVGSNAEGPKYAITRQEIEEANIKITTDKYRKFESFNHTRYVSGEEFLSFGVDPLPNSGELQPRASQILYCLLRKHCLECRTPPSYCNVPGCAGIKTAIWESQEANTAETPTLPSVAGGSLQSSSLSVIGTGISSLRDTSASVGSGYHVADIAVREFMLNGLAIALTNKVFAAPRVKTIGLSVVDWGSNDGETLGGEKKNVQPNKALPRSPSRVVQGSRRAWRGESIHFIMRCSGHQFRSMHRYLFSPQLSQCVSQDDYISMRRSALHNFFNETDDAVIKRLCHRAHVLQNEQIRRDNMEKRVVVDTSRDIDLKVPCTVVEAMFNAYGARKRNVCWHKVLTGEVALLPVYAPPGDTHTFDPYPSELKRKSESDHLRRRQGLRGGEADDDTRLFDLGMIAKRAAMLAEANAIAAEEEAELALDSQPMSKKVFEWLCSRLVITRRGPVFGLKPDVHYKHGHVVVGSLGGDSVYSLDKPVSLDASLLTIDAAPATFKFDRLFSQKSFFMKSSDAVTLNERRIRSLVAENEEELEKMKGTVAVLSGTFVRVQILYGVLNGYPSFNIPEAGCPPAATRFCHTEILSDLGHGLTVLVYDYSSEVSRALLIQGGLLLRVADALGGRSADLADLALRLHARAEQLLVLSRVGTTCTGIDLDPSGLSAPAPGGALNAIPTTTGLKKSERPALRSVSPFRARVRSNGTKQFAVDLRTDSISAAQQILNLF